MKHNIARYKIVSLISVIGNRIIDAVVFDTHTEKCRKNLEENISR